MPRGESFEGITVPEGDPDGLRAVGQQLSSLAGAVEAAGAGVSALPNATGGWSGQASAAFAGATLAPALALGGARDAFDTYATTLREGAEALDDAQKEAERAIDQARAARKAIQAAETAIDDAQGRLALARTESAALTVAIAATGPLASAAGLESRRSAADAAAGDASADLTRARAALERARDDLEQAKKRGKEAMEAGREAKRGIASVLSGLAPMGFGLTLARAPSGGGGGGGGGPVFGPDGSIRRLDLSVEEFDRMSLADRQHWMRQFQEEFGPEGNFNGWFRNIEGILEYAGDRDTIEPGTQTSSGNWFSLVDAAILHGIQNGYARSRGRPGGGYNAGTESWQRFFEHRDNAERGITNPTAFDEQSKRLWAAGEQASTDYGADVVAPENGRTPTPEESTFLWIGDQYREKIVPNLPEGMFGYGLADPRNQEFTRDVAEGIDDTSSEAVEGARETTDEGLEAAREIVEAPGYRKPGEVFEGALETGGQVLEGTFETGGQVLDTAGDTADDLAEEGVRVVAKKLLPGN